jgi:hypothetical protein
MDYVRAMDAPVEVGTVLPRAVRVTVACTIAHSADDIVGVAQCIGYSCHMLAPNIVWYQAYKIVCIDNVLMLGQRVKHWCHVVPSWHGLPDHHTLIFWCQWCQRHFVVIKFAIDFFVS